jgi:hypothetical protein
MWRVLRFLAALEAFFDRHQASAAQYGFFTTTAHSINERQTNPDGGPPAPSAEGLLYIEFFGNASCHRAILSLSRVSGNMALGSSVNIEATRPAKGRLPHFTTRY